LTANTPSRVTCEYDLLKMSGLCVFKSGIFDYSLVKETKNSHEILSPFAVGYNTGCTIHSSMVAVLSW